MKPALLPKEFSRWLHEAFLQRQSADYGAEVDLSSDEIATLLTRARDFLAGVRRHLNVDAPDGT